MAAITESLDAARNRDFEATLYTEYLGGPLPITGASVVMEVRLYPGAAGAALISVPEVQYEDVGVIGTAIDPDDGIEKDLRRLVLYPSIARAALAGLPGQNQPEAGDAQSYHYEIMLIYADAEREPLWMGAFVLQAGIVA